MAKSSQGGSTQFCGQCGAALLPDAKFCATCGATVQPGAVPTASKSTARPQAKSGSRLWLAVVAGVILVGVLAVAFLLSQQQPAPATAALPAAPAQQDIPYPGVARVSVGEAHGAANAGQAVIVDVRDREFIRPGAHRRRHLHTGERTAGPHWRASEGSADPHLLYLTGRRVKRPCGAIPSGSGLQRRGGHSGRAAKLGRRRAAGRGRIALRAR